MKDSKKRDIYIGINLALTGEENAPPLGKVMELLGKEETLRRLDHFIEHLSTAGEGTTKEML